MFKNYFLAAAAFCSLASAAQKCVVLKPVKSISIRIPEPSDICYNAKGDTFFIVSDNGVLFETDYNGKILRQVKQADTDFEAVYSDDQFVYAVDETHRNIFLYSIDTFKVMRTENIPYYGGRNKGYEAFTFNKSKNEFVVFTEKDPAWLFELDKDFSIKNRINVSSLTTDISAATYYNNALWILGDEDRCLIKLNPETYEVIAKWKLPVINPEGFAFDKDGNFLVTCDDMQRLYYFNNPEQP
jgi:uncharacterized protein YjiK